MPQTVLNKLLQDEITLLAKTHKISADVLEKFAGFTIANYKKKPQNLQNLSLVFSLKKLSVNILM